MVVFHCGSPWPICAAHADTPSNATYEFVTCISVMVQQDAQLRNLEKPIECTIPARFYAVCGRVQINATESPFSFRVECEIP